jgi:hypothetical protein
LIEEQSEKITLLFSTPDQVIDLTDADGCAGYRLIEKQLEKNVLKNHL